MCAATARWAAAWQSAFWPKKPPTCPAWATPCCPGRWALWWRPGNAGGSTPATCRCRRCAAWPRWPRRRRRRSGNPCCTAASGCLSNPPPEGLHPIGCCTPQVKVLCPTTKASSKPWARTTPSGCIYGPACWPRKTRPMRRCCKPWPPWSSGSLPWATRQRRSIASPAWCKALAVGALPLLCCPCCRPRKRRRR